MFYYTYISNEYCTKNKLEKEIGVLLVQMNRRAIQPEDLPAFKQFILDEIAFRCTRNPRCKPIKPYWHDHHGSKDSSLSVSGVCNFYILCSNAEPHWVPPTPKEQRKIEFKSYAEDCNSQAALFPG